MNPQLHAWAAYAAVPARVNITRETLDNNLEQGRGGRIAIVGESGSLTYDTLAARVNAFAASCAATGIRRGDRVLIRMWNCPEFVVAFLGLTRIGAMPVLQNSAAGVPDVDYVLSHSDAVAAVTLAKQAAALRELRARLPRGLIVARGAVEGEHSFEQMSAEGSIDAADTEADEPAFMCYTSGTTGRPKGIVHAHRWLVARGDANRARVPPMEGDVIMAAGEWSFISLLGHNVLFALRNGVTCAAMEGRPSAESFLHDLERFRVTVAHAVPTLYRRALAIEGIEHRHDLSRLRGCNASGEALGAAALQEWKRRFGSDIWEHYGISEFQLVISQSPRLAIKPGSIGVPWGTMAIIADESDRPLPVGEVGQLLLRDDDPGMFLGYHKDPAKTREVVHDGWFHTGDLAWRDEDGYFWIAGRNDDCFKSRGIFIVPIEIENALMEHPAIAEACVVPVPDAQDGNLIRAVVVARQPAEVGDALTAEVLESLKKRLQRNKVPHRLEFVPMLPKSPVGKILRREIMRTA